MMKKLFSLLPILSFFFILTFGYSDIYRHTWDSHRLPEKDFSLSPQLSYFWSSKNFDRTGKTILPTELSLINKTYLDILGEYGVNEKLTAYARLSWSRVEVNRFENERTLKGNRFGFGNQSLGLNYKTFQFNNGSWMDLQVQADIPAYSNLDSQKELTPYLGDQTIQFSIGPFFTLPFGLHTGKDLRLEAGAAFTWRSKNYSAHIPWKLGVYYLRKENKGLTFSLATYGLISLKNDQFRSRNNSGFIAGGSHLTSAANPSYVQLKARIGNAFSPTLKVYLEGGAIVWGYTVPKGQSIGVFAEFRFGKSTQSGPAPREDGFVSYDFQASVLEVNDRLNLLKVDKGTSDGVLENQEFDIFSVTSQGKIREAIARGRVISTKENESVIKVIRFYKEVWIEKGFIIKRPI